MFRHICACAVVAILFAIPCVLRAADEEAESPPKKPSAAEAMSKYAKLGPGVHAVKKDKKGRIVSCHQGGDRIQGFSNPIKRLVFWILQ